MLKLFKVMKIDFVKPLRDFGMKRKDSVIIFHMKIVESSQVPCLMTHFLIKIHVSCHKMIQKYIKSIFV